MIEKKSGTTGTHLYPLNFFKVFCDLKDHPLSKYQAEWFKNKIVAFWAPITPT
jgi:hypothetical protein